MKQTIQPADQLNGSLQLPPDKSISHRAALFGALYEGRSVIKNYSEAEDPQSTLKVLKQLGVAISQEHKNVLIVDGIGRSGLANVDMDMDMDADEALDCGNAGTLMRLLCGMLGGAGTKAILTGDESLRARTMQRVIKPLREMNIEISGRQDNYAPLRLSGNSSIKAIDFELPIPSAQLKSCVLLAGLFGENSTHVIETIPSRDHTERMLALPITKKDGKTIIQSNKNLTIPEQSITIPGDFSAAAFWLVAGSIIPHSTIRIENVGLNPSRVAILEILEKMGADIFITNRSKAAKEPSGDITIRTAELTAFSVPNHLIPNCIDELPILAVAMACAEGVSELRGAEELRHKETDRIAAMAEVLRKAGAEFEEYPDGFIIDGNTQFQPEPAEFNSYHDHRIAMAASILALRAEHPSTVLHAECAGISYPDFYAHIDKLSSG